MVVVATSLHRRVRATVLVGQDDTILRNVLVTDEGQDVTYRVATTSDRDALAALHVLVWRDTYRDLAPATAYRALDETNRRSHWDDLLQRDSATALTLVAESGGSLAGFGHASPGTHEVMVGAGEVVHLYVDPAFQGRGIGMTMLRELTRFLTAAGHTVVRLAVVRGNDQAVRFYERAGGRIIGEFVDGVLWRSDNHIIEIATAEAAR